MSDRVSLRRLLDGPPPRLPSPLDAASERWWRLRPRARAAIVVTVALVVVAAGLGHVASSPWGAPVTVLVAAHDLEIGQPLTPSAVTSAGWPQDLVPSGALSEPAGTVVAPLPAGSVVTDRHVSSYGLAAALPDGRVRVPLPADLLPDLPAGARLDLVGADLDGRGVTIAHDALLIAADGSQSWVSVDRLVAADVAAAGVTGQLTAVVLPP